MVTTEERVALTGAAWEYQDRLATAFNEISVLEQMGREGWELVSFGPLVLNFRRPETVSARAHWEYCRTVGLPSSGGRKELEQAGWTYAGSWLSYHYFKRQSCVKGAAF
ncbi:DUF2812 domain-containing protein [Deinococcus piscis]|nr:DUF2812 domain-containing protein [Deinococcus piscis]